MKRIACTCIVLLGALCLSGFVLPPLTPYQRPRATAVSPR